MSSEYDRKAAAWVRKHYPSSSPETGSVTFDVSFFAYESGAFSAFDVNWTDIRFPGTAYEHRVSHIEHIREDFSTYDATDLIRELVEMPDPGE